ncbi:MAG: DMT family transporter [Flavobacteriaceae bacterium]
MIALILSIASSTLIFIVFKLFDRFKIATLHAIVVNYLVACCCGLLMNNQHLEFTKIPSQSWFFYALALGAFFIGIFNLMAWTTQKSGLSVVSVATKMSVVIPILFGLLYYSEHLGIFKFFGILLALLAVYLTSVKSRVGVPIDRKNILYPGLVFLGSGIIDTSLKYLENRFLSASEMPLFSATLFFAAASVGLFILAILVLRGSFQFQWKNVLGGLFLGIPNYFSVYFLLKALKSNVLESSGIFTVNNVGIVMLSTVAGIVLFHEKLLRKNWIGIGLAIASIALVAIARN